MKYLYYAICFLFSFKWGSTCAQDTIFLENKQITVGELEWQAFHQYQSRKKHLYLQQENLYGKEVFIEISFYPRTHTVEQLCFGFQDSLKNFVPHGPARIYYPEGELLAKKTYLFGESEGNFTEYYPFGVIRAEGTFKKGLPEGKYNSFYENGSRKSQESYNKGKQEGLQRLFYEDGTLKETFWVNEGQKEGADTTYYPSGAKETISSYHLGEQEGRFLFFYESGELWTIRRYEAGLLREVEYLVNESGSPMQSGSFHQGNGKLYIYSENGVLIGVEKYKGGKLTRYKRIK